MGGWDGINLTSVINVCGTSLSPPIEAFLSMF